MEETRRNLQSELLQKELQRLRQELELTQTKAQETQKELQTIKSQRDELTRTVQLLQIEKEEWNRQQNELNTELRALREKHNTSVDRRRYEEAQQQITTLSTQLKAAEGEDDLSNLFIHSPFHALIVAFKRVVLRS
jgi:predicted  nucleic acid-binding Zn-ribbon protein